MTTFRDEVPSDEARSLQGRAPGLVLPGRPLDGTSSVEIVRRELRLRVVGSRHYVCSAAWNDTRFSRSARRLLAHCADANHAVIATDGRELVGFFRWFDGEFDTCAAGTWVHPAFRRSGLALRMWTKALASQKGCFEVVTATRAGEAFVRKLRALYPQRITPSVEL